MEIHKKYHTKNCPNFWGALSESRFLPGIHIYVQLQQKYRISARMEVLVWRTLQALERTNSMKFMDCKTGKVYKTTKDALEASFGCRAGWCDNCLINLIKGDSDRSCEAVAEMNYAQLLSVVGLQWVGDESCYDCSKYHSSDGCLVGGLRIQLNTADGCPKWVEWNPKKWTPQEVEDAKTIQRMFGKDNFTHVQKDEDGWPSLMDGDGKDPNVGWCSIGMEKNMFPSLKPGETGTLDEIVGCEKA